MLKIDSDLQQVTLLPTTRVRHSSSADTSINVQTYSMSWSSETTNQRSLVRTSSKLFLLLRPRFRPCLQNKIEFLI